MNSVNRDRENLREKVLVGLNLFSMAVDTDGCTPELLEQYTNRLMEDFSLEMEQAKAEERQRCLEEVDKIYTKFESDKPPMTLNKYEASYNNGLFDGRLNAMENVTQVISAISSKE